MDTASFDNSGLTGSWRSVRRVVILVQQVTLQCHSRLRSRGVFTLPIQPAAITHTRECCIPTLLLFICYIVVEFYLYIYWRGGSAQRLDTRMPNTQRNVCILLCKQRYNNNNNNKLGICIAPYQRSCSWCFTLDKYTYYFIRYNIMNSNNVGMQHSRVCVIAAGCR